MNASHHTHCTCDKYLQPFDSKLSILCSYCLQEQRYEADRAKLKRFPLVAADRRTGEDRRANVEHALSQPMPKRRAAPADPQRVEQTVQHIMRLARECANKHANNANWLGLEAAIRKALTPPL